MSIEEKLINIDEYKFCETTSDIVKNNKKVNNWPVVYIINNKKEAYIGETTDPQNRIKQHLKNPERDLLELINIISSETFNKSVILDLEAFLIKHMSADGKFKLQNGNSGLQFHNYYQQKEYEKLFGKIWDKLKSKGLVNKSIKEIENSDLYKYSPYKTLTDDQLDISRMIIMNLAMCIEQGKGSTMIINGEPGTGKTILAIYLIKLLSDLKNDNISAEDQHENEKMDFNKNLIKSFSGLKIGLVIPMDNFRETVKEIFRNVYGLNTKMILSPKEVPDDKYDILIVDEAHRLRRKVALSNGRTYIKFNENNKKLNIPCDSTELDWMMKCSKYQILMYDKNQSIRTADIRSEDVEKIKNDFVFNFTLKSQLRCLGGNDYINYIDRLLSDNQPEKFIDFRNNCENSYDFKLFDDVNEMIDSIKEKDKEVGLCRNFAGDAWPWINKGKKIEQIKKDKTYDIVIDKYKYIWNTRIKGFITSPNAINEIGCIHTAQGCDVNYAGVIIGKDLRYDPKNKKIFVDENEYTDKKGIEKLESKEELKKYIIDRYKILLTRGIKGTYIYVCDHDLREYMKKYILTCQLG